MNNGNVNYNNKNNNNCVRAVSEFRMITMNAVYNISLDELFEAYWTCRRKKSRSRAASLFEADYEPSNCFDSENDSWREFNGEVVAWRPIVK